MDNLSNLSVVDECGFSDAQEELIVSDASLRQRKRLKKGDKSVIVTFYPEEEKNSMTSFVEMSNFLRSVSLSAPMVLGCDYENGVIVEEDFGNDNFNALLHKSSKYEEYYFMAVEVLVALHNTLPLKSLKVYNQEQMTTNMIVVFDYIMEFFALESLGAKDDFLAIWEDLFKKCELQCDVTSMRDYHSPNIMILPDRVGLGKIGIIDFQDATLCSKTYDFVSLAQDARYSVKQGLFEALTDRYISSDMCLDKSDFLLECAVLGVQRAYRIIGVFVKKMLCENNSNYLSYLPLSFEYIHFNLKHPELLELKKWFLSVGILKSDYKRPI